MTTTRTPREEFELLEPLDDRPGPAKRISSQRAADMVRAALDRAAETRAPAAGARKPRRWRRIALVAAATLAVAGGASAAIYELTVREPAPTPPQPERRATSRAATTQEAPRPEPTVSELRPEPEPEPTPGDRAPPRRARADRSHAPATAEAEETPEDLLARANEKRKERAWRRAASLYERVRAEHTGTSAAYVATLALASIRLEHLGDARGALRLYRAAMSDRPNGYLAEEARYGIAEAHRALGDPEAEAEALAEFLGEHPGSPLRERAERRLERLRADRDPERRGGAGE